MLREHIPHVVVAFMVRQTALVGKSISVVGSHHIELDNVHSPCIPFPHPFSRA